MLAVSKPFFKTVQFDKKSNDMSRSHFFLWIWIIYILLSPFYVFSSGVPQPADLVVFIGILLFFAYILSTYNNKINSNDNITSIYIFGSIFVGLTAVINFVHYMFTPDITFILHSFVYPFNFAIFLFGISIFKRYPITANRLTYYMIAVGCFFELIAVIFFPDTDHYRASGTFNQSNQLAYWGVLSASMILVLKRDDPIKVFDIVLLGIIAYIEMKALSKAGLLVYLVVMLIIFFSPNMSNKMRSLTVLFFVILLAVKFHNPHNMMLFIDKVEALSAVSDRLMTIGKEADDSAAGRGYLRMIEYPRFLLFGAGEGAYWRFGGHELHSGIGTILLSYSIFGFAFFLMFLGSVFYRLPWYYTAMLIPIFLYGITHQNVRFSLFWVFLAVSFSQHFIRKQKKINRIINNEIRGTDEQ